MRRFEFCEGGSNKFWEIELDGSGFTVRWGKLGSAGQSALKSFADPNKARLEYDKLIREKTSKGYQEVVHSAIALERPGSSPEGDSLSPVNTVAEPTSVALGGFVLGDALKKKLLPWRGGPVSRPNVDIKKVCARLQEVRKLFAQPGKIDIGKAHIAQELQAALVARVAAPIDAAPEMVAPVEACFLSLIGGNDQAWDRVHELAADMVHLWCDRVSPAFALQCLLLNYEYGPEGQPRPVGKPRGYFPYLGPWRALRGYLALCDESTYQEALNLARPALQGGELFLRLMLALVFSQESDFVNATAREFLCSTPDYRGVGLLASTIDPENWASVCQLLGPWLGNDFIGIKPLDYLPTGLARLGETALPALQQLTDEAKKVGERKQLAEMVANFVDPEVGQWFSQRLQDKAIGPIAAAYLQQHPHLLTGQPVTAKQKQLSQSVELVAPAQVADSQQLPSLLVQPPWLQKLPKRVELPSKNLELLAFPEHEHFPVGLRERYRSYFKPHQEPQRSLESCYGFAERLCEMPDVEWALQLWNSAPASVWNPYDLRSTWSSVPSQILAHFGCAALPGLLANLATAPVTVYEALAMCESPRVAETFAQALVRSKKYRATAQKWFKSFPQAAAVGLIPAALRGKEKEREAPHVALRWMAQQGQREVLLAVADQYGVKSVVSQILEADPLLNLPAQIPSKPAWWRPACLVPPRLRNGAALPVEAIEHIGTMLSISTLDSPYAGLEVVRDSCQESTLQEFAWSVYQAWLLAGGPAKEDWGFTVLGHFGGDHCARQIAPELRRWPSEGLSSRAALGLDVLCAIGTDVALMHLHAIAQKVRHKSLQEKAQAKIEEVADNRGLTLDELADRLVPDLDLGNDGSKMLDFGPRQFRVSFDQLLRPQLRDSEDRWLGELPKPNKSDDPVLSAAAVEQWKALKKDAKTVASTQLQRLEQGLARRRRWTVPVFRALMVEHPLLGHLVRRLVWGSYQQERLLYTFRVAEDGTLADSEDRAVEWPSDTSIGVFHPLDDLKCLNNWRVLLADYQILQPFAQIERPVILRGAGEESGEIKRFEGKIAPRGQILRLEGRGWRRGNVESGVVTDYQKNLTCGLATLAICIDGGIEDMAKLDATLQELVLPANLHPVEFSEVLLDIQVCLE